MTVRNLDILGRPGKMPGLIGWGAQHFIFIRQARAWPSWQGREAILNARREKMQDTGESCPFSFNFDPQTFKVGDTVSYRVTGSLADFPFVGTLVEVHDDHVIICAEADDPNSRMRGTRESRPVVGESEIK